mgnify:CR=1 FL=1
MVRGLERNNAIHFLRKRYIYRRTIRRNSHTGSIVAHCEGCAFLHFSTDTV